jgi:hypothetical protein
MPIVAITSLLAGSAMAGVVVYMQRNPLAFTSVSAEHLTQSSVTRPSAPVYLDEAVEEEQEQTSPPAVFAPNATPHRAVAVLRVRKPVLAPAAAPEPAAEPAELAPPPEPCKVSDWRVVGFKPTGAPRRVRAICP